MKAEILTRFCQLAASALSAIENSEEDIRVSTHGLVSEDTMA